MQATTYTTLMQVDSRRMETYVQHCPDPCTPWWQWCATNSAYVTRAIPKVSGFDGPCIIKAVLQNFQYRQKGWGAKRICNEFLNKNWALSSVKDLLRKIDKTNSISPKVGSGRKRTVRTTQNIECVAELICRQEGNPGSSKISRQIQKGTLNSCLLDCFVVVWSFRCFI